MIAPQTTLGRQLVAFLREYPGTDADVLEREFGTTTAIMCATIDGLVARGYLLRFNFGYYAAGAWDADDDEAKAPAPLQAR